MLYDMIVVGGGPAGLAAALAAWNKGLRKVLILERDGELGGILNQCIHNGFGLQYFKKELTGPEYAGRFIRMIRETDIRIGLDTMVLEITPQKEVHAISKILGYQILHAKTIVLAMGCRERARGSVMIPGTRPAGVLTAGTAQRYVNMEGYMPGRRVVILGSGDIGLIMARRMVLEGAEVLACVEIMSHPGGLNRNIVQCLHDYSIPLYLSHTITDIKGRDRVERVTVSKVDDARKPIPGTEIVLDCDTVLLSVGLIPENELSKQAGVEIDPRTGGAVVFENMETSIPGIYACGNAVHVHDLVDFVTIEGEKAGSAAAQTTREVQTEQAVLVTRTVQTAQTAQAAQTARDKSVAAGHTLPLRAGEGVSYTVPQIIRTEKVEKQVEISFRTDRIRYNSVVRVMSGDKRIAAYKREYMAPGEMERITLPLGLLETADRDLQIVVEDYSA